MPDAPQILPVAAMVAGVLVQNYAEWRGGGPVLPESGVFRRFSIVATDHTRFAALRLVSVALTIGCATAVVIGAGWLVVAIAASLVANALAQLFSSLIARKVQPGTLTGLIFMLPPALWVIGKWGIQSGWIPIVIGPLISVPILFGIWWLASLRSRAG